MTSGKATFEEACAQSNAVVTVEKLRTDTAACMAERDEVLARLGWSSRSLCEESARRMHALIAERQARGE